MDKTRLYHGLFVLFGVLALAWGAAELSSSLGLTGALFVLVGIGMILTSGAALVRPDLDSTDEPSTLKLVLVALGVALFGAGVALTI
jgi:hypothetical protein